MHHNNHKKEESEKQMKRYAIVSLLMFGVVTSRAQWGLETSLHTSVDDNVNNNYEQLHDNVTQMNLGTGYTMDDSDWNTQVFYVGSYNYYSTLTDKIFWYHSAGITSSYFGLDHEVDLGATFSQRLNRSTYSFLGYNEINGYITYRAELGNGFSDLVGYNAHYTSFDELTALNNFENTFSVNLTKQFESRTTVVAGGDIGVKWYSVSENDSSITRSRGSGGIMKSLGTVTSQTSAFVKIGQSVFEQTGISGLVRYRVNILNNARSLATMYSVTDDEIFDTRYGYEGLSYEINVKQLFAHAFALDLGYGVAQKNYINSAAYDGEGNILAPQRNDTRYIFSLALKKGFDIGGGNSLAVMLLYDSILNASNDHYYNYSNNVAALRLSLGW